MQKGAKTSTNKPKLGKTPRPYKLRDTRESKQTFQQGTRGEQMTHNKTGEAKLTVKIRQETCKHRGRDPETKDNRHMIDRDDRAERKEVMNREKDRYRKT